MTILATHFAIVLGAWRLRIRIDIDEPRSDVVDEDVQPRGPAARCALHPEMPGVTAHGRG